MALIKPRSKEAMISVSKNDIILYIFENMTLSVEFQASLRFFTRDLFHFVKKADQCHTPSQFSLKYKNAAPSTLFILANNAIFYRNNSFIDTFLN